VGKIQEARNAEGILVGKAVGKFHARNLKGNRGLILRLICEDVK
jgi:hypothetical protein